MAPFDPELDRESPWSREVGGRLARALERLGHCASDLPSEEPAEVTLRFVYAQDGTPVSSHVVSASSAACPLVSCLEPALREVRAPKLLIERGSYDLAIALKRGQAPERVAPPGDGLVTAAAAEEGGCVDPAVAALSRERVDEVVASTFDGLKACYGQALARDHHASGHVAFEFVIGQQGSVNLAQAREATLYDCAAIDCMLAEFRRLSFPAPVGRSVRVIYPVRFSVEQPPVQLR